MNGALQTALKQLAKRQHHLGVSGGGGGGATTSPSGCIQVCWKNVIKMTAMLWSLRKHRSLQLPLARTLLWFWTHLPGSFSWLGLTTCTESESSKCKHHVGSKLAINFFLFGTWYTLPCSNTSCCHRLPVPEAWEYSEVLSMNQERTMWCHTQQCTQLLSLGCRKTHSNFKNAIPSSQYPALHPHFSS